MSIYFEAKTNDGYIQVNDQCPIFRLEEVYDLGTKFVATSAWTFTDYTLGRKAHNGYFYQLSGEDNDTDVFFIHNPTDTPVMLRTSYCCPYYRQYAYPYTSHYYKEKRGWWVVVYGCEKEIADSLKVLRFTNAIPNIGNCGLECFDASGKMVFSSNCIPMKIVDYQNVIHTTNRYVFWTGDWTMQTTEYSYNLPIGVWGFQMGCGGTNGEAAGYSKQAQFYLTKTSVKLSWMTNWDNEHQNVRDKWFYWSPIFNKPSPLTNFCVLDASLCL